MSDVVDRLQLVVSVLVCAHIQLHTGPAGLHICEGHLNGQLLVRVGGKLADELSVCVEAQFHDLIECKRGAARIELHTHTLLQRSPVTRAQGLAAKILDQRNGLAERVQFRLHGLPHLPALDVTAQLAHTLGEHTRSGLQLLHVEVLELAVLPVVPVLVPLNRDGPDLGQEVHIFDQRRQVRVLGGRDAEDSQTRGQGGFSLLRLGDLELVGLNNLQSVLGIDFVGERQLHVRGSTDLRHLAAVAIHLDLQLALHSDLALVQNLLRVGQEHRVLFKGSVQVVEVQDFLVLHRHLELAQRVIHLAQRVKARLSGGQRLLGLLAGSNLVTELVQVDGRALELLLCGFKQLEDVVQLSSTILVEQTREFALVLQAVTHEGVLQGIAVNAHEVDYVSAGLARHFTLVHTVACDVHVKLGRCVG